MSMTNTNVNTWTLTLGGSGLYQYTSYKIYFQSQRSSDGATTVTLAYSTDGSTYTNASTTASPGNGSFAETTIDLSAVTALNNQAAVYIKFSGSGATNSAGTLRIDNLEIQGTESASETSGINTTFNGAVTAPTLSVTGNASVNGSFTSGATTVSSLSTTGAISAGTFSVSGSSTLGSVTSSSLNVSSLAAGTGGYQSLYVDSLGNLKTIGPISNPVIIPCATAIPWTIGGNTIAPLTLGTPVAGTCNNVDFILEAYSNHAVWIKPSGYVGIGTANPSSWLDVSTTATGAASGISLFKLRNTSLTNTYPAYSQTVFEVTQTGQTYIGAQRNLNTGGHPSAMLHVNGDLVVGTSTSGPTGANIWVTETGWADFVFDKEYKLMPLTEVEKFYKANHHLPSVPSQKEIQENGNNLGQTDVVLLQKIEELTLYMVKQQKQLEEQQKLIETLAKKLAEKK